MASETEFRSRPIQRQAGFNVGQVGEQDKSTSRVRTTTGDTVVRGSVDGDIEMGDDKRGVQPLPIPRSQDAKTADDANGATGSSRGHNDLPTPPDDILLSSKGGEQKGQGMSDVKLPSLHSTLISPRITTISSSHVSSGPASLSSAQWSPGRSSDPHLYSISGQPYSNASVKPYLSTSFQTSAERGAGASTSAVRTQRDGVGEADDEVDDVFGNTAQGLGLHNTGEPSPPQLRRSNEMDREDGDAAGVFSFSSPYFGPRSLETSDVPPLSPPPPNEARALAHGQRMMSPSWTAASLGKLSLGGPSTEATPPAATRRPLFGASPRHSSNMASAQELYSRSLPSAAGVLPTSSQGRRPSFNRRPQPGPGMLHPHASYQRPSERARSSSRHRLERATRTMENVDDDETDEDELMATHDQDDDATEDEAEPQVRSQFTPRYARYEDSHYAVPHRHPSGQQTTMSASYERAQSGLSRQYSSDRYAHLAMSRHHPYAISPSGASPNNVGVLSSHSPGNARGPLGRRRSSFGSGSVLSGSPSNSMMHALSHSPRYIQSIPTRERPPMAAYIDQSQHPASLPKHAVAAYAYGESPDGSAYARRYRAHDEEEEDDEEDGSEHRRRPSARSAKPSVRSTSASRAAQSATAGGPDVESSEMVEVNAIRERLGGAANCSAFISKLWYLMCRPELYSVSRDTVARDEGCHCQC